MVTQRVAPRDPSQTQNTSFNETVLLYRVTSIITTARFKPAAEAWSANKVDHRGNHQGI